MKKKPRVAHNRRWRDPLAVIGQAEDAGKIDPALLRYRIKGAWWKTLHTSGLRLLVSREYEHFVLCLGTSRKGYPEITYLPMPHPSGIAVDRKTRTVYVTSTRNPNQVYAFRPAAGVLPRGDVSASAARKITSEKRLMPHNLRYYPGSLYMHDLAVIGGRLYANAVGHNAVVRLPSGGGYEHAWWPKCIGTKRGPRFGLNYLQLNSIAAGRSLRDSYFTASTGEVARLRPGHPEFPVDGRGVVFSGRTGQVFCGGLTRPHSARLSGGKLYVLNSGYGELGTAARGGYRPLARFPGWTRGLAVHRDVAFVGLSRVLPRFRNYAPGLAIGQSRCGVYAVGLNDNRVLGAIEWPAGDQIFAVEVVPSRWTKGWARDYPGGGEASYLRDMFYGYTTD